MTADTSPKVEMIYIKFVKPVIKLAMPGKSIIQLEIVFYGPFIGIQNHEICVSFAYVNTQIVLLHMASFSVKNEVEDARNHQSCLNTVSLHQVIPRLKPGGRKKLRDGLEAQGTILLFRHNDSFTEKR